HFPFFNVDPMKSTEVARAHPELLAIPRQRLRRHRRRRMPTFFDNLCFRHLKTRFSGSTVVSFPPTARTRRNKLDCLWLSAQTEWHGGYDENTKHSLQNCLADELCCF